MERVLQAQENALNGFSKYIDPGKVSGLMFLFKGTNATATPATLDDLGDIVIKRDGETIVNRPVHVIADIGNVRAGSNLFTSTGSGDFIATVKVPFFIPSFEQSLEILSATELNFTWEPKSGLSAKLSPLTLSVYAEVNSLNEEYDYFLLGEDQTPAAAIDSRPFPVNADNVSSIWLTDDGSVLESAGLRLSGKQVFSDQPKEVLEAGTLYENKMEQNTTPIIELQAYTPKDPRTLINQSGVLTLSTSGSGTILVTRESIRLKNEGQGAGRLRR